MKYDPFRTDPTSASRLMTLFFSSSLCGSSTILPQEHLLRYAKTGDKVSTKERLFICTTLALGSLFSHDKALRTLGIQLASWAVAVDRETCFTHTNLSVILARLNLALYYFAVDEHDLFQHYLSVGLSDLKKLGLNVEGGAEVLTTSSQDTFSSLGLPTEERVEAMRRAFWLGFLAEVSLCGHLKTFDHCTNNNPASLCTHHHLVLCTCTGRHLRTPSFLKHLLPNHLNRDVRASFRWRHCSFHSTKARRTRYSRAHNPNNVHTGRRSLIYSAIFPASFTYYLPQRLRQFLCCYNT